MQANQQPSSARASEAPNMVFAVEPFANGARSVGFSELIEANYAEMERHKQLRKMSLDRAGYDMMDKAGKMRCYSARVGGELVGYATFFLSRGYRYDVSGAMAFSDLWFLKPAFRSGDAAARMLSFVENDMRKNGVIALYMCDPLQRSIWPLLKWAGFMPIETTYEKILKK